MTTPKAPDDTREFHDRCWGRVPQDLRDRAATILRRELPELVAFVADHPDDWEDLREEVLSVDALDGTKVELPYPWHMAEGMHVRNVLRLGSASYADDGPGDDGVPDEELPSQGWYYDEPYRNWDDVYVQALEYAAGTRP